MKIIIIAFIVLAGLMVIGSWALAVTLITKSGKGILSLYNRQRRTQWLSTADTIAQYGNDYPID